VRIGRWSLVSTSRLAPWPLQSTARQKVRQFGRQSQKAFRPQYRLSSLLKAQRRRVAGSGRQFGSLVGGASCSQLPPPLQVDSQACCRQRKLYWPQGGDQLGRMVKVTPHGGHNPRRTQIQSWHSSWACLRR